MATHANTTSRFHNLPDEALADAIGRADAVSKAVEAELKALKDEFKRRGLTEVAGDAFTVTATEQIAGRLDAKAVKEYLGEACVGSLRPRRDDTGDELGRTGLQSEVRGLALSRRPGQ